MELAVICCVKLDFFFIKTYIHKLLLQICVMYILPNKPITQTIFLDSSRTTLF